MPPNNMIAPNDVLKNMKAILTRVNCTIGRYRTLIVLVGTSSDTNKLHNNLNIIKEQMIDEIVKSQDPFLEYCKIFVLENVTKEERDLFERLYAFYLTSIEYFMQMISKYVILITEFNEEGVNVINVELNTNTGTFDMPSLLTNPVFSKSQKSSRKSSVDNLNNNFSNCNSSKQTPSKSSFKIEEARRIEKEFYDLSLILHELYSSIHLSHWNIIPEITINPATGDKESQYSSDEEIDPNEKHDNLDVPRKTSSQRRSRAANSISGDFKRTSVQVGMSQYISHTQPLLKSSMWHSKRKVYLIIGSVIAIIIVAIIIIVPSVMLVKPSR